MVSAKKGLFVGTVAPFGYKKDPDQHGHLLIDEETAPAVKYMFQLAAEGHGPNFIRKKLEEAKIPTPAWWSRERGLRNLPLTRWEKLDPENGKYVWDFSVIKDLLINPVYIGAVSGQKRNYRFKLGTISEKKPEEWIVVEGCHEPIIDKATFEIVQEKLKSRQRSRQNGEFSLFAGLIKCGECGKALTHRLAYSHEPLPVYCCKTYNAFGKTHCTQHRVTEPMLKEIVLNKIRECAQAAQVDDNDVAKRLQETCETEQRQRQEALAHAVSKDEERLDALNKMILQLYEDRMLKHISEENFSMLMEKTQQEQTEVQARIDTTRKQLSDEVKIAYDAQQWKEAISQYADIQELDAATLNRLVKSIVVHEKIGDDGGRDIAIEIHFNLQPITRLVVLFCQRTIPYFFTTIVLMCFDIKQPRSDTFLFSRQMKKRKPYHSCIDPLIGMQHAVWCGELRAQLTHILPSHCPVLLILIFLHMAPSDRLSRKAIARSGSHPPLGG